jgi:Holliday junction resolvasome RuvABC endonuclease subunit
MAARKRKLKHTKRAGWRRTTRRGAPQRRKKAKQPHKTNGDGSKLLAFDFSSACTGFAYFESGTLKDHGKHVMSGKSHSEKLNGFLHWVIATMRQYKPTAVAFEAPFQGRHANAYGVLSMYKGVVLSAHWHVFETPFPDENQIPAHIIKKVLGMPKAKGATTAERHTANKRMVIKLINGLYGTSFQYSDPESKRKSEDDVADAVAVGHAWYALHVDNESDDE